MSTTTQLADTLEAVRAASTSRTSRLHGEPHWRRVASHGLAIAAETPGTDPLLTVLFGLFHDSMRLNDGHDPQHGARGAALLGRLNDRTVGLDADRLALLQAACTDHTLGGTNPDPTIGACWDSDRLDLVRLYFPIDRKKISTPAARTKDAVERAFALVRSTPEWPDIFERLERFERFERPTASPAASADLQGRELPGDRE